MRRSFSHMLMMLWLLLMPLPAASAQEWEKVLELAKRRGKARHDRTDGIRSARCHG